MTHLIKWQKIRLVHASLLIEFCLFPGLLYATESLTVIVTDKHDNLVDNVVISAFPQYLQGSSVNSVKKTIVIDQKDKEFIDHVTVIQAGTYIDFPNHDQIHHHVYSFSPAKPFEIPLYLNSPERLIMFDKTGVVTLGCNIHDWMSAYIYVLDTPYFSTTNNRGIASLELPPDTYEVRYWHPNIDEKSGKKKHLIKLSTASGQTFSVQIGLKKSWTIRRGPLSFFNRGIYR